MLVETQLGKSAIEYIEDSVSYGTTLEKHLNQLPVVLGRAITYLPEDSNPIARENFHAYKFWSPKDRDEAESRIEDIVINYLAQGETYYAIFEDAVVNTSSLRAFSYFNQTMYKNEEIYYYLTSANTAGEVRKTMEMSLNWRAVGVCFHANQELQLKHSVEISDQTLEIAANALDILLIGAYDEGSWLLWLPPEA